MLKNAQKRAKPKSTEIATEFCVATELCEEIRSMIS